MEKNKFFKDKLKPYVHKIKGAKYSAFYDILNGDFYQFRPQPGDGIEEVRRQLKEAGLLFETGAFVPYKTTLNVPAKEGDLGLRKLQIRISGFCEDTCWNRVKKGTPKEPMPLEIAGKIAESLQGVPIHLVTIEAAALDGKTIAAMTAILKDLYFEALHICLEQDWEPEKIEIIDKLAATKGVDSIETTIKSKIPIEEINTTAPDFFYSQTFNPCLGHQAAIDTLGQIKPCLWYPDAVGNIKNDTVRDIILKGKLEPFWDACKNKIQSCKDCEYRYNCNDCRIHPQNASASLLSKPRFCGYDPYLGEGVK